MGKSLKGKELGIGITQRKDGKYSAKFKSVSGKRVEKYFDKLAEARKWLEEAKYEDSHGNIAASTVMTVDAWFNYWITEIKGKTVRLGTIRNHTFRYNQNVKNIIGSMVISDVKPMHCQNILNIMDDQNYAGGTIRKTRETMCCMFSDAVENGMILYNPITKSVKNPRKVCKNERVLTIDEQKKFLNGSKCYPYFNHFVFVLQTGLRVGELRGLKWQDVDFSNKIICIKRSVTYDSTSGKFIIGETKTDSGCRDIPLTEEAYNILLNIKQHKKIYTLEFADYIFSNCNGRPIKNSGYNRSLSRICKRVDIPKITMHTLRHTFATRCIESGMKPKTLQKILGHSNISMKMDLYVHVTEDEKEKEMKKFEKIYKMA